MEATERLVRTWMASGKEEDIERIVAGIAVGESSLINLVKALGEYLTAEEDEIRTKGVELLSSVLARCPPESFNTQSVRVLTAFYVGKLEDTETIVPALKGLLSLSLLTPFTSAEATTVVNALFAHVKMRALVQAVRFNVFSIVDSIMSRHRQALKDMGSEFLTNYIALADGEKDPRNLMVAFAIARVIGIEFDIKQHVENFFNIVFCYFPITFRPPPDDPYGITADDLRKALRLALASTPQFGPLAFPMFVEKLMAGSPVTKRDTLLTLSAVFPIYGAAVARDHAKKLWNSLRLEIFQPTDDVTEAEAIKTTQDLIKTVYAPADDENAIAEDVAGIASEICEECLKLLQEPEKNQAGYAAKVLSAFLSTTPSVSQYTLSASIPPLLKTFQDPDEAPNRRPTLAHLSTLVSAAQSAMSTDSTPLLSVFKDEVLGAFTAGLKLSSVAPPALTGLKSMVSTPGLLTDEEIGYVVHSVNEILQEDADDELSDAALDLLSTIATSSSKRVEELTLPLLFASLPDAAPARDDHVARQKTWRTLSFLARLCRPAPLFDTLVVRLLAKTDLVVAALPGASSTDREPGLAYMHALLHTLADVLGAKVKGADPDVAKHVNKLVPHLYGLFIISVLDEQTANVLAPEARLVEVASTIIGLVVQATPAQKQTSFLEILFPAFMDGRLDQLVPIKIPADARSFRPFEATADIHQRSLLPLFAAAIIPMDKEAVHPVESLPSFLERILEWSVDYAETTAQRAATFAIVATIVNKHVDALASFLGSPLDNFWSTRVSSHTPSSTARMHAISAWMWVAKGLLVRNHSSATAYAERLFELFADEDDDVNAAAARALGEIPASAVVLAKSTHAVVRMLYAQKYCNKLLPQLMQNARISADPAKQRAHLIALTSLVKSVSRAVYADQMPALMPLLLRGLDLPDFEMRASVLDTLYVSAAGAPDEGKPAERASVAEHAPSLVAAMLQNSAHASMPSAHVRVAALRYLALMPNVVRYDAIHPQRARVLRELFKALDDPKKAVRRHAVDARSAWYTASA